MYDTPNKSVVGTPVEERWKLPEEVDLIPVFDGLNVSHHLLQGQDALRADKPLPLNVPGEQGDNINSSEQTRKQGADDPVGGVLASGRRDGARVRFIRQGGIGFHAGEER